MHAGVKVYRGPSHGLFFTEKNRLNNALASVRSWGVAGR
jgi:hypothetical protein